MAVREHYWRKAGEEHRAHPKSAPLRRRVPVRRQLTVASSDASSSDLDKVVVISESSLPEEPTATSPVPPTGDGRTGRSATVATFKGTTVDQGHSGDMMLDMDWVLSLLDVAFNSKVSTSSVLPGRWRFDERPNGRANARRTIVCPCGRRLHSMQGVAQHLAGGDSSDECAVFASEVPGAENLPHRATKLGRWQHKFDEGLTPSD